MKRIIFISILLIVVFSLFLVGCQNKLPIIQPTSDIESIVKAQVQATLAAASSTESTATITVLVNKQPVTPTLEPTFTPIPPTVTPILPTATLPPGSILFEDNFTDGNADGWIPATGTWQVIEGQYTCVSGDDPRAGTFIGESYWGDYTVSADVKAISGAVDLSVLGRLQDADHYYNAQLWQGNARIYRRDGSWTQLVSVPYATTFGTWYNITLKFSGTRISMYVNGVLVTSAEDAVFLKGKVGFRCATNSQAYFDNIIVKTLEK